MPGEYTPWTLPNAAAMEYMPGATGSSALYTWWISSGLE